MRGVRRAYFHGSRLLGAIGDKIIQVIIPDADGACKDTQVQFDY